MKDRKTNYPTQPPSVADLVRRKAATDNGLPIILCYTARDAEEWGVWKFKCQSCRHEHIHGAREGLRTAHCPDGNGGSYYLVHHSHAHADP